MMKVVVTGATGKIGRWAVRTILEAGHDVVATDRLLREESASKTLFKLSRVIMVKSVSF